MVILLMLGLAAWLLGAPAAMVLGCAALALLVGAKRLEANRLPLPGDARERRSVLWRRLWFDRDAPPGQAWESRRRFD